MPIKKTITATIQTLSKKGHGRFFSQDLNCDIEVPFTLPSDVVEVELLKKRKGVFQSNMTCLIEKAKTRTQPKCAHFSSCGGCVFQQLNYSEQLKYKDLKVKDQFACFSNKETKNHSIIADQFMWRYRNKVELSFSQDREKNRFLGFMMHRGRGRAVNLKECYLAKPWIIDAKNAAYQFWQDEDLLAYHPFKDKGHLRTLTLRDSKEGTEKLVMLTVSGHPDFQLTEKQKERFKEIILQKVSSQNLSIFIQTQTIQKGVRTRFDEELLYGPGFLEEQLTVDYRGDKRTALFKISPKAFFQPNPRQAEKLYSKALSMVDLHEKVVLDLYCGTGTLSNLAAPFCRQVIGIEIVQEAVLDAKENSHLNNHVNTEFIQGDVQEILKERFQYGIEKVDVIFVDPPREGLKEKAIMQILSFNAKELVYISCNPTTQAEDMQILSSLGYQLMQLQAVDQFPHTVHIENILLLQKS